MDDVLVYTGPEWYYVTGRGRIAAWSNLPENFQSPKPGDEVLIDGCLFYVTAIDQAIGLTYPTQLLSVGFVVRDRSRVK